MALSTFTTTSASLTLTTGEMLELQPGTNQVLTHLDGWFSPAGTRREGTARLWAHGSFSERGWRDQRVITVGGHIFTETRTDAANMTDTLSAALADGTAGTFIVDDADLGYREATVYITGTPTVNWDGGLDIFFMIDMVAPDPRKYGEPLTVSTVASAPGGGLDFGLFTGADSTTRINYALNPEAVSATGFATYLTGTSETGTTTYVTGAGDGPAGGPTSYARRSVTAAKTGGSTGFSATTSTYIAPHSGTTGDSETASVWLRYTGTGSLQVRMRATAYSGTTAVTSTDSNYITLPTGQWVRVSSTVTATGDYDGVGWWAYFTSGNVPAAGSTLDATGVLIESGSALGTWFSGRSASTAGVTEHYWGGAADASLSTEIAYSAGAGNAGVLDFGAAGSPGTVTLENVGTADSAPVFTISGYAPGFTITEVTTGARLIYTGTVLAGQTLTINAADGSVLLDGYADRSAFLTRREWTRVPGRTRYTYLFESPGNDGASLTLGVKPAWW